MSLSCRVTNSVTQALAERYPTIKGASYTPSCGRCELPPWEECECSALLAPCYHADHAKAAQGASERINAEADERLRRILGLGFDAQGTRGDASKIADNPELPAEPIRPVDNDTLPP